MEEQRSNAPKETRHEEYLKLLSEYAKHITTISTACVLVVVTILAKTTVQPKHGGIIPVSLVAFGVAVASSVLGQGYALEGLRNPGKRSKSWVSTAFFVGQLSFLVGILALLVFTCLSSWAAGSVPPAR